mgnify:CR=1 FL=1
MNRVYGTLRVLTLVGVFCAALAYAQRPAEYNNLGIQSYDAGRYTEAIAYFERAYEGASASDVVRRNLCNAHQARANELAKNADFARAVRHLETAVSVDPENPSPLVQLGSYYLRLDEVNEAIFRLEEAIELKPGYLDAHEMLGEAYYRDNDIPSARAQWEYVLEMAPNRTALRERYDKAFREEMVEYDFNRAGSRHFRITYPPGTSYQVRERILRILERAYMDIGRTFSGVYPPPPIQVIAYTAEQFAAATQLDGHVGAVYDGKIRTPLTDRSGRPLSEDELKRRLTHEYVHVVIRNICGAKVPWWLNEGAAEAFSHDVQAAEVQLLDKAAAQGVHFSLRDLEAHQLKTIRDPELLRMAYAHSHITVDYLWKRYGQHRFSRLLSDIASGAAPEQALKDAYQLDYASLQQAVFHSMR